MTPVWTLVLAYFILFQQRLCCTQEVKCTASSRGRTTTYKIDSTHKNVQADDCDISWHNKSNHVLANQQSKLDFVMNNSISELTIEGCIPIVSWHYICISEGIDFTANCNASCLDHPELPAVTDNPINSTHSSDANHVVISISVVFTVIVTAGILYALREKICRKRSCGQMGGIYSAGKPVNTNIAMVEVSKSAAFPLCPPVGEGRQMGRYAQGSEGGWGF